MTYMNEDFSPAHAKSNVQDCSTTSLCLEEHSVRRLETMITELSQPVVRSEQPFIISDQDLIGSRLIEYHAVTDVKQKEHSSSQPEID